MSLFKPGKQQDNSDTAVPSGIIILGCPRSGTTLIRRLLDAHPDLCCPGETFLFRDATKFLEHDTISGGFPYGTMGALEGLGFDPEDVKSRLRDFTTGFYKELTAKEGKKIWVAKTAVDSFHLPQIEELFAGHVKFICLLRHGLDVVCSLDEFSRDLQSYVSELHRYIRRYPEPYKAFAHAWTDVTTDMLDLAERQKDSCHVLQYEALVEAPDDEIGKIFDFIGVDRHEETADNILKNKELGGIGDWKSFKKNKIEKSSIARWEKDLPDSTVTALAPIINPTLERAGYEAIAAADDEDEKRRQELAMMMMRAKGE